MFILKNSNFSENWDLLPWVQKNLLPSKTKESTWGREGELKIKFENERMWVTGRNMENFFIKKKKEDREKKVERERNSNEEGEEEWERGRSLKKKYEEGEEQFRERENLKNWKMRTREEEWKRRRAWEKD
jgi:hypothetical protein